MLSMAQVVLGKNKLLLSKAFSNSILRPKYLRVSPKNYDFDGDQGVENNESSKKAAVSELQPVIIQSESSKKMVSYNPISVDYGLRKAIGSYEFCKPLRNGNLMVKCNNVSQIKTLVNLTEIFEMCQLRWKSLCRQQNLP